MPLLNQSSGRYARTSLDFVPALATAAQVSVRLVCALHSCTGACMPTPLLPNIDPQRLVAIIRACADVVAVAGLCCLVRLFGNGKPPIDVA
ncbi:MAG TPA: hypothetical protein VHB78_03050 [Vicinamibacterales bacterium]|jgi:hypothetical protein|nr:hypothetical protein [Vicinamibacterales bacterium]